MLRVMVILAMLIVTANSWALAREEGGFPEKGSYQAWLKAAPIYNEGNKLSRNKQFAQAIEKYRSAIAIYPQYAKAYHGLASAMEHKGDLGAAELAYGKSIELDNSSWRSWNDLAGLLYTKGKYSESKQAAIKALQCNPPAEWVKDIKSGIAADDEKLQTRSQ